MLDSAPLDLASYARVAYLIGKVPLSFAMCGIMTIYNQAFYEDQVDDSIRSGRVVLPVLFEYFRPHSVVDVGCGLGTWLAVCRELGVPEVLGLDGDYVPQHSLKIPKSDFQSEDLSRPFSINRRFDLAISLEVAEHLPTDRAASFVSDLVSLSDVVLFSAAIPYQGGTGHVNENWPEYWAAFFKQHRYRVVDCLRPQLWNIVEVCFWYRQNLLVFVKEGTLSETLFPVFPFNQPLAFIHPELFLYACSRPQPTTVPCSFDRDREHLHGTVASWDRGELPSALAQPGYGKHFETKFKRLDLIIHYTRRLLNTLCRLMKML